MNSRCCAASIWPLAAAADRAGRPCRQPCPASVPEHAGYRLIRRLGFNGWYVPAGIGASPGSGRSAATSCENIIWRCRCASCAICCGGCAARRAARRAHSRQTWFKPQADECRCPKRMETGACRKLSAVIITRNEAANIAECLQSLAFCDERIVVDDGSTDDTVRLARERRCARAHPSVRGVRRPEGFRPVAGQRRLGALAGCRRAHHPGAGRAKSAMRSRRALRMATRCRAARPSAAVPCAIRAGFRTMFCGCSGATRRIFRPMSCMNG